MVDKITRYTADLIDWNGPGEQNREPATDIRERLRMMARRKSPSVLAAQLDEAADEIERLRERVEVVMSINHQQGDKIERLEAERIELRALLKECSDDLASELEGRYSGMLDHPAMKQRYDRDMQSVLDARALLGMTP